MKRLFDENLSYKLVKALAAQFPESVHVRDCGLKGQSDQAVWDYAKAQGFTIVSKDDDFHQRSFVYGPPPKVILAKARELHDGASGAGPAKSEAGRHRLPRRPKRGVSRRFVTV